jgi:hypothetical protein
VSLLDGVNGVRRNLPPRAARFASLRARAFDLSPHLSVPSGVEGSALDRRGMINRAGELWGRPGSSHFVWGQHIFSLERARSRVRGG